MIAALYDAAFQLPLASFQDFVFAQLETLVPFDSGAWETGAGDDIQIHHAGFANLDTEMAATYIARFGKTDLLRKQTLAHPSKAFRLSDVMAIDHYHALAAYKAVCQDLGIEHALAVAQIDPLAGLTDRITVWRGDQDKDFSDDERQTMEYLAPHIITSWQHRQMIGLVKAAFGFDDNIMHEGRAHAIADKAGLIRAVIGDFGARISEVVPGWKGPKLPTIILDLIKTGPYFATLGRFEIAIGPVGDRYNIVVTPISQPSPLSAAEMRTVLLFAAGSSYKDIAKQLSLSTHTVRNQISSAYRKLGVHSKMGLAEAIKYRT